METITVKSKNFSLSPIKPPRPPLSKPQFPHKNELLTKLMNFPPHEPDQVENMAQLVSAPGFKDLPDDVRNQILDGLPYRFNTTQLTARPHRKPDDTSHSTKL
jgi:hypothetical protein